VLVHIPDQGHVTTWYYERYANRSRRVRRGDFESSLSPPGRKPETWALLATGLAGIVAWVDAHAAGEYTLCTVSALDISNGRNAHVVLIASQRRDDPKVSDHQPAEAESAV